MDKLKQHIQNNLPELDIDQPKQDLWNALSSEINRAEVPDPLKEHIEQYTEELDFETPGENSWSKIKSGISSRKPVRQISYKKLVYYVAAACLVIFIVVSTLIHKTITPTARNSGDIVKTPFQTELTIPNLLPVDTMKAMAQAPSEVQEDKDQVKQQIKELAQINKKDYNTGVKRNIPVQQVVNKAIPQEIIEAQAEYDNLIAGQVSQIQSMPLYGESVGDFAGFIDDFKRLDQQEKKLRSAVLKKGMEQNTLDELAMIYQKKLTVLKMLQREIGRADSRSVSETDTIPAFIKLKKEL